MKKYTLILVFALCATNAFSQRFMTRTGKVTFFSSTSLESIEAVNNETACILDSKTGSVAFQVPIKSFKFERALMEEHFNENYMESDKFAKAEFKGDVANISSVDFAKNGHYNVTAKGKMTIHGVTRDVSAGGTLTVQDGKVTAASKFSIHPGDYDIKIPGVVAGKIAKDIEVTVSAQMGQR